MANPTSSPDSPADPCDPLTGFYRQDYLLQQLARLLRQQRTETVQASLLLLQLENFYEIRRWVGRLEADLLLSDLARLLAQTMPSSVLLCRCTHYEFAVLLTGTQSAHAPLLIQQVKQALRSAVSDSIPPQLELRCAAGLAVMSRSIPSAEVMFARARHSLSMALSRQRTRDPLQGDRHDSGMPLSRVRAVLRANQLQLNFQPLLSLKADGLEHYEVRCQFADACQDFSVSALFETAIQNALGERIDRWVITRSLQQLDQPGAGNLYLTINLSQNSVVSHDFFHWLRQRLASVQNRQRLCFQLSELDILGTQHHMAHFCAQLTDLNIRLSVSHFGCTTNPFRYLPLVQAHCVKLDASLLENIADDHAIRAQLEETIRKLQERGIRVIAPMVEQMHLLPLLWSAQLNFVQGFCIQAPCTSMQFCFLHAATLEQPAHRGSRRTN